MNGSKQAIGDGTAGEQLTTAVGLLAKKLRLASSSGHLIATKQWRHSDRPMRFLEGCVRVVATGRA